MTSDYMTTDDMTSDDMTSDYMTSDDMTSACLPSSFTHCPRVEPWCPSERLKTGKGGWGR